MPRSTPAERRPAGAAELLPHDLVEIASPDAIVCDVPPPAWVRASLARAPFVVVRRSAPTGALVAVGVRGTSRSERFGAGLPAASAVRRVRPEDLAEGRGWRTGRSRQLTALDAVERLMAEHGLRWGPVGSVGFELATGVACVTEGSDLDDVARAPTPLAREDARRLHAALAALPVRVDVQLETPAGGVALAEYAGGGASVVLRTPAGPRRVASPWGEAAAPA
jgi:phosphoribosyl-dephospho-CoA transferase